MVKCSLVPAAAAALGSALAFAQEPALTAGPMMQPTAALSGETPTQGVCWYNGDLDYRNGLASDRNTLVPASWTFDDVNWEGGVVTGFRGQFITNRDTLVVAADIIVYRGVGEGEFGTLIAEVSDVMDFTFEVFGWFGNEYLLQAYLGDRAFDLPPDTYHVGIRVVGIGQGQAFVVSTSGINAVGSPRGNNGRAYFQSDFFGYPLPTAWENIIGGGPWDASFGLMCHEPYRLTLIGPCPGVLRIEWRGAEPNRMQAILFARREGEFIIHTGPCAGTRLGLSANRLHIFRTIGTGMGAGTLMEYARYGACGGFVQLIQTHSCATSNVAQVP